METAVTFTSDGLTLAGDLHVPAGAAAPRPAFVVLHGFAGSKDRSHAELMARLFESWGYAALRFDFPGCGMSEGRRGHILCHDQVADAKNALTWLAQRPEADPAHIAVRPVFETAGCVCQAAKGRSAASD